MKKNGKIVLRVLLTVLVLGIAFAGCVTTTQAIKSSSSIESAGTGFFISSDGYVVTCAHVLEKADTIGVWVGADGYRATLVAIDESIDLAILKVDYKPSKFFRFANFDSAHTADKVYALGFPLTHILGSEIRVTDGIISARDVSGRIADESGTVSASGKAKNFQISAPVQPGNSGGPVINARFEVLGVVSSKLKNETATNVSFAVKNTFITPLLPQNVRISGGNVSSMQDAIRATVQITHGISDGPDVTVVNSTGYNVKEINISPHTHSSWNENRLENNQVLSNGESVTKPMPAPLRYGIYYDFRAIDTNGNVYEKRNVMVSENARIVFNSQDRTASGNTANTLAGTYYYGTDTSITFSGNRFTLNGDGTTVTGSYSVSGNTFTLTGHGRTWSWITGAWTITDSNTLRDADGDLWKKSTVIIPTVLSGTYSYKSSESITFSGNSFTLKFAGTTVTGSYSVSGNTFTLTGHGRTDNWITGTWTITDANTLRASDGTVWEKSTVIPTVLSGTYSYGQFFSISFSGNNYSYTILTRTDSGTYRVSGNKVIFSKKVLGDDTWDIVDANTLRDPDGDLWKK
jgi:hypothetical protein